MKGSSNRWTNGVRYLAVAMLLALCACGKAASSQAGSGQSSAYEESRPISLALVGYNYTNRYIDTFSVNSQGGGNLYISSPTSGGGGTVCCVRYWPGAGEYKVKVRWQSGACYYRVRASDSDEVYKRLHSFYKETEVNVTDHAGTRGRYMEVHFYPNGTVQAAVTADASMPRLSLSKEREDNSRYPRCPNDEKPGQ